jgi:hypothetical protein
MDASGTATPIRNARVTVGSGPSTRDPFFTDVAGRFEFSGLAAGRYTLAAEKAGFARTRYGSRHDLDPPLPLDVADAAIIEGIEITLPKGAAIAGQVVDELGDPVVGVPVSIGFRQTIGSETRFVAVARPPAETDDRGEYRIGGLAAGQYFLSVAGSSQGASIAGAPPEWARTMTWGLTFYQTASSLAGANPIQLAAGEELTGIDLTVEPFRPATLSLALTDVSGAPAAGLINLMMRDESLGTIVRNIGAPFAGKEAERRTLTLDPGEWVAVALQNGPAAFTHFRLSSGDETTLTLTTRSGAHVAGRVVFEGSTTPPRLTSLLIGIRGVGADAAAPLARGPAAVSPDGTFELTNVFGTFELRPVTLPRGWVLRAERYGDRDLLDEPLTLNGGEDIRDVQMILTDRLGELAGMAVDAEGRPSPRCAVTLMPDGGDLRV